MTSRAEVSNERGRFVVGPGGHPRFAGSSTGIYLADTVWTAVSPVAADTDLDEAFLHRNNRQLGSTSRTQTQEDDPVLSVDAFAKEEQVREDFCTYFRLWHPLFPFLDGRLLSQRLEEAFVLARGPANQATPSTTRSSAFPHVAPDEALVYSTIFRAVITLGSSNSDRSDTPPSAPLDRIHDLREPGQAMYLVQRIVSACQISRISEILALQGLLAVQVLLFGLRETRTAMHVGGLSTKIAYEAGLHRCPNRFLQTFRTAEERDLRKRIFYSLYSLDRLLSAEFGIPLTMNDTDIDTCLPGDIEVHQVPRISPPHPARSEDPSISFVCDRESIQRDLQGQRETSRDTVGSKRKTAPDDVSPVKRPRTDGPTPDARPGPFQEQAGSSDAEAAKNARLQPALTLTRMTRMVGVAMETFNKSLEHRHDQNDEALSLRVNLDKWWNDIGLDLDDDPLSDGGNDNPHLQPFSVLFTCLYYQQIINIARPSLSLSPTSVRHALALQSSINSVRTICTTLTRTMKQNVDALAWPGYVDMLFFGSLILVYGARKEGNRPGGLKLLKRDLGRIHRLLKQFDLRWKHLKPLIRIVEAFLTPLTETPQSADSSAPAPLLRVNSVSGAPIQPPPDALHGLALNFPEQAADNLNYDPVEGNFFFDFDSFELHPASIWAYRPSIPNSPR
ncbi:hypothetical protein NCC49_004030 [Naganishia albida]|nr:hypothetical protein NCC49_004030 [Naganishia albida]